MTGRSALVWMTHVWDEEIANEFEKILHMDYPGSPEVWLILDARTPHVQEISCRYEHCHVIVESELFSRLPYPRLERETLLDHVHFPVLDFYLTHPEYDYYWVVEFDVRYTGDWGDFFYSFEPFDHDLITSHIRHYHDEPSFGWWCTLQHPMETIDRARYLRSFNVIYRISRRALALIDEKQRGGWRGFIEVLFPTLLHTSGYTLLDFGGDGPFVPAGRKNAFYTSGSTKDGYLNPFCSIRWRPSRARAGVRKNTIYHPVKPDAGGQTLKERIGYFLTWTGNYFREKLNMPLRCYK